LSYGKVILKDNFYKRISYQLEINFIIGYLHPSLLGFVSLFVLGFMLQQGLYRLGRYGGIGLVLFLAGFFATELMLMFGQGTLLWLGLTALPSFNWLMFWASVPMPLGLGLLFLRQQGLKSRIAYALDSTCVNGYI
jgi:hypothetical protein